ncbi:zona pellucida sperm-binding protein 1-like, partial [Ylistrum balloti]|uniref:zona pellucida sperm-binding protein 1-like n=1 Tax=Ylistrum balloti TaxID=509963 RepID=UPI002905AFFB
CLFLLPFTAASTPVSENVSTTEQPPVIRSDIDCNSDTISLHVPLHLLPAGQQVTWNDPSCVVADNGTHLTGHIGLGDCGTYVVFNSSHVTFENELVPRDTNVNVTSSNSGIDFGSEMNSVVLVQCVYPRREQETTAFLPVQGQVRFFEKTLGHMQVHMRQARDLTFSETYQNQNEPRAVRLNDPVYIKLTTDQGTRTKVAINVDRCLATPSPSPLDTEFQELTNDGCPAISSVTIHSSPTYEVHLSFHAFQFINHPGAPVYVHCEVYVCPLSNPQCVTGCTNNVVGRSRRAAVGAMKTHMVSTGPFPVTNDKEQSVVGGQSTALVAVTGLCAVLAVVAAVFGVLAWRGRRRQPSEETFN